MSIKEEVCNQIQKEHYSKSEGWTNELEISELIEKAIDLTLKKQKEEILQKIENRIKLGKTFIKTLTRYNPQVEQILIDGLENLKKEIKK